MEIPLICILTTTTSDYGKELEEHLRMEMGIEEEKIKVFSFVPHPRKETNDGPSTSTLLQILTHTAIDDTALMITQNHLYILEWLWNQNIDRALILEDDARFHDLMKSDIYKEIEQWLHTNTWDIFYFGYCPWPIPCSILVHKHVVRLWSPYTAHAYMIRRSGIQKIMDYVKQDPSHGNNHFDKILTQVPGLHKYGIFPSICFQKKDPALYTRASKILHLPIPFQVMSRSLEIFSVVMPILIMFLIIYIIVVFGKLYWTKK